MNLFIPLGLFLVLLCYVNRLNNKRAANAFVFSMSVVCVLAMIRWEFGPDYFNYYEVYEGIQGADIENYVGRGMTIEKTFLYFLRLFPNYTSFIIFLTIFWFSSNTFFLKTHVPSQYYWFVLLYFIFKSDYFLDGLVAMRTTMCAAIFLIALHFLIRKQRLIYVALIVVASLFHTSAIGLMVFVFVNSNRNSFLFKNIVIVVVGIIALVAVLIGYNPLLDSLSSFVMENVDELQRYSERDISSSGTSLFTFIFRLMTLAILVYLSKSASKETDPTLIKLYQIAVVAAMINLMLGQSLINDRYFLILNPVYILCIVISYKKNPAYVNAIISLFILVIALYILYNKFSKPYFVSFLKYKTIFSAPVIP